MLDEKLVSYINTIIAIQPDLVDKLIERQYENNVFIRPENIKVFYLENRDLIIEVFKNAEISDLTIETLDFALTNDELVSFSDEDSAKLLMYYENIDKKDEKNKIILNVCEKIFKLLNSIYAVIEKQRLAKSLLYNLLEDNKNNLI